MAVGCAAVLVGLVLPLVHGAALRLLRRHNREPILRYSSLAFVISVRIDSELAAIFDAQFL